MRYSGSGGARGRLRDGALAMRTQIAVAEGQRHQLGARAGAELALSVSHMSSHGLVRDVQILRDLAPGLPQRDLFDDLQLAFGESDGALGRRRGAIPAASVISRPPSTKS
jgi:hypothetical protein